jgi:hypothetical protein
MAVQDSVSLQWGRLHAAEKRSRKRPGTTQIGTGGVSIWVVVRGVDPSRYTELDRFQVKCPVPAAEPLMLWMVTLYDHLQVLVAMHIVENGRSSMTGPIKALI